MVSMGMIVRGASRFAAAGFLLLVAACASGPTYVQVQGSLPPVPSEQGRIYVYREGMMVGSGIQPSVMLNGQKVGDAVPGGFFFVDRPPGTYTVSVTTETERTVEVPLAAGQTQYVRMDVALGVIIWRVTPKLVPAQFAEQEIRETHYLNKP